MTSVDRKLEIADARVAQDLFGEQASHLRLVEDLLGVRLNVRGSTLLMNGEADQLALAGRLFGQLYDLARTGFPLVATDISQATRLLQSDPEVVLKDYFLDTVFISARKRPIVPRSINQKVYVESIRKFDIVFGVGPAGTGKTYLAVAMAVAALTRKEVSRIILTRPAVEAGERLGFLPGDLAEKINPYLQPLHDALGDMVASEKAAHLVEKGVVQVAPLAFMRGRTLSDAFVILDEAQNTTPEQMKMFLTRLGTGSRAVITGDVTQIDLPAGARSGLVEARQVLEGVPAIRFVHFTRTDVVRHPLVQQIISAYEVWEKDRPPDPPRSRRH